MSNEPLKVIEAYTYFWADYEFNDLTWNQSYAEGKATIAEIIGHLMNWDHYLISNVVRAVKAGKGIEFPDFDSHNKLGYEYVKNKTKNQIVNEFKETRIQLHSLLIENLEIVNRHTTANGVSNCPNTGTPYSLLYIIQEFIEHDEHHKKQIESVNTNE
ncbi:DinB family protein [Cohnella terricola]|nr:DinB family protein [Cohnella terricola]